MKGEVLVYIEGTEDSYKLYSKDKKAADSLYYDLEKCPICIDRPGGVTGQTKCFKDGKEV